MRRSRSLGFTLLELLVVIGIITILAAMLLPVLGRSKGKAKITRCVSNLHQLGLSIAMYTHDSLDRFPPAFVSETNSYACVGGPPPVLFVHWHEGSRTDIPRAEIKGDGQKFISPILFVDGHAANHNFTRAIQTDPDYIYEQTRDWMWYKVPPDPRSSPAGYEAGP